MPIYITIFESQITKNETALESIFKINMGILSRKNKNAIQAKYEPLWAILNKTNLIETLLKVWEVMRHYVANISFIEKRKKTLTTETFCHWQSQHIEIDSSQSQLIEITTTATICHTGVGGVAGVA